MSSQLRGEVGATPALCPALLCPSAHLRSSALTFYTSSPPLCPGSASPAAPTVLFGADNVWNWMTAAVAGCVRHALCTII